MSKINQLLLAFLIVQISVIGGIQLSGEKERVSKPSKVFVGIDFQKATKIEIKAPFNESTQKDNEFILSKENDQWKLDDAEGYPADSSKLEQFLKQVNRIKSVQLVTSSANYYNKLKVADDNYERKITIWTGESSTTFYLGTGNGPQRCHFRVEGSEDILLIEGLLPWDVYDVAGGWINPDFFSVNKDDIWGIKVSVQGKSPVSIARSPLGSWSVEGQTESPVQTKVDAMLTKGSKIVIDHPVGKTAKPEHGFNTPTTIIEVITGTSTISGKAPKTYTTHKLIIGTEKTLASNKSYFARKLGSEWIATLPSWSLTKLTNVSSEELVTE